VITNPLDPRPASSASVFGVLTVVRNWMRTIILLNTRPPDERQDLLNPPGWLRTALLVSLVLDIFALTKLTTRDLPIIAALTVIYILTMLVPPVASPHGLIRTPRVAYLVTLMLFWSPLQVLVTVAYGTLLAVIIFRLYEPSRALLNTIFWAYPAALASFVAQVVVRRISDPLLGLVAAVCAILVAYLATNFAATSLYRHLLRGEPFWQYWWRTFTENPLSQLLAAPVPILLGAVAHGLGQRSGTLLFLTAVSAFTMPAGRAQLAIFLASQRTVRDIVRALMIALERVVPGAQAHAERVSELVGATGRRLRVSANTLESWRIAGLLHDIGLIDAGSRRASAVSHAIVGARILDSYPDSMVADMVREHHTPWSAIPPRLRSGVALGARVLAAAEVYDELRYGTPTHAGVKTHEATVEALRPLIGKYLEPRVAAVLLDAAEEHETKPVS
jgi:putative nucleotidyltransferase with HDIG domain